MPYTIKPGDNLWNIWLAQGQAVSWTEFKALNSQFANPSLIFPGQIVNLPGDAAAAAAPTPAPSASPPSAPPPAPSTPSPGPVPVLPGLSAQQWEAALALQAEIQRGQLALQEEQAADSRRLQEAQLGANPADFVAYELYKRSLVDQGFTPEGTVRSDSEIQELVDAALGLNVGDVEGTGRFGVDIPTTGSISRSELQSFSPTDIGVLSSFLSGGVDTGEGEFQGINPEDFFTELEEGLVPVLPGQRTQFKF